MLGARNVKAVLGAASLGAFSLTDPTFAAAQTFLGNAANNALGGQLQVQITVDGGKITAINTPVTLSGRNASYSNYAVPILTQRALSAQSANIQGVSGASYVSSAWKQSLASAIAKAGSAIGATTTAPAPATTTAPAPATTTAPAPKTTIAPPRSSEGEGEGFEHEDGEDGNDGYHPPRPPHVEHTRPPRTPKAVPTIAPKAIPTPAPSTSASALGLTMGAGVIKKTITCVKGTSTKTVKAINPKCPTGYTLKKK
jgi:hypothetical protein